MGRRKLPMNLISNKRARLVCFETRKKGLKKAAHELSILCGVDIGMIIYDRDSNESEICGSASLERMIQLYDSCSAQDRRCRAYNVLEYLKEERDKAKKMREKKGRDECGRLSPHQLRELGELLDAKIAAVRGKISSIKIKTKAAEADDCVFLSPNFSNQQSGLFLNSSLNQENGVCFNAGSLEESGLFSNPNFVNQDEQQQAMSWGNSSLMQEGLYFMADDVYGNMQGELAWGNSGLMQETNFYFPDSAVEQQQIDLCNNMQADLVNPSMMMMMNQSVEGIQNFMPSMMMNQSVEGIQNFMMPGVIQQQQWQAYYHPQEI